MSLIQSPCFQLATLIFKGPVDSDLKCDMLLMEEMTILFKNFLLMFSDLGEIQALWKNKSTIKSIKTTARKLLKSFSG